MVTDRVVDGTPCQLVCFLIGFSLLVDEIVLQEVCHCRLDFSSDMSYGPSHLPEGSLHFRQSLATLAFWTRRSLASAKPSLHAKTSNIYRSDTPVKKQCWCTEEEATDTGLEFFDFAASTLILTKSSGGEIHPEHWYCTCLSFFGLGFVNPKSAIKRPTKLCVDSGDWKTVLFFLELKDSFMNCPSSPCISDSPHH